MIYELLIFFFFIVIFEEGTETLEPYIVASLTEHVQHLILIGNVKILKNVLF
jgi:hypothetical protein